MSRKNSVFKTIPFNNIENTNYQYTYRNSGIFNNLDSLNQTLILDFVQEKSFLENASPLNLTFKNLDEIDTTITDFNLDNLIVDDINIEAIHTNITNGFRNSIEIGNLDIDDYTSNIDINIVDNSNIKNTDIEDSNDLINNSDIEINNTKNINDVNNSDTKNIIDNPIYSEFESIIQSLEEIINNLQNSDK